MIGHEEVNPCYVRVIYYAGFGGRDGYSTAAVVRSPYGFVYILVRYNCMGAFGITHAIAVDKLFVVCVHLSSKKE